MPSQLPEKSPYDQNHDDSERKRRNDGYRLQVGERTLRKQQCDRQQEKDTGPKPDFYSFTLKIKLYSSRIPEKSTFLGFFSISYIRYALIVL